MPKEVECKHCKAWFEKPSNRSVYCQASCRASSRREYVNEHSRAHYRKYGRPGRRSIREVSARGKPLSDEEEVRKMRRCIDAHMDGIGSDAIIERFGETYYGAMLRLVGNKETSRSRLTDAM